MRLQRQPDSGLEHPTGCHNCNDLEPHRVPACSGFAQPVQLRVMTLNPRKACGHCTVVLAMKMPSDSVPSDSVWGGGGGGGGGTAHKSAGFRPLV